ncbi:unnamed protein product, partial [Pocillopora meandrina]
SPTTLLLSLKNNRVVAGTSQLRISEFYTQGEHNSTGSASSDKTGGQYLLKVSAFTWVIKDGTTKRRKLELVSQYSLFDNIECLKAVRLAGKSRDSLLLSFKDAKSCNQEYFWPPLVCGSRSTLCSDAYLWCTYCGFTV